MEEMYKYHEELRDLYILMKALQKNDNEKVRKYRKITGNKDDCQTLMATIRFMQIGMVQTYQEAKALYEQEKDILLQIEGNRDSERFWKEANEQEMKQSQQRYWERERARDAAQERLRDSEQRLREAREDWARAGGKADD